MPIWMRRLLKALAVPRDEQGASQTLDIARDGERQERLMKSLKRRLRSLALAGRKCAPDPG
jgi:hypothetical protein